MSDIFGGAKTPNSPSDTFFAITASPNPLARIPRYVYVGTAGNLTVAGADGSLVTFNAVPAGTVLPIRPRLVTACPANTLGLL